MRFSTFTLGCKVNQFEMQAMENILESRGHSLVKAGEGCDACIINTCTVTAVSAGKSRRAARRLKRLEPNALIAVCGCLSQLMPKEIEAIGADIIGGSGDRRKFVLKLEELCENAQTNARKTPSNTNSPAPNMSPKQLQESDNINKNNPQAGLSHTDVHIHIGDPKERKTFEELPCGVAAVAQITRSSPAAVALSISKSSVTARTRALLKIQDGCNNYCAYCVIPYARGRSRSLPPDKIAGQARQLKEQGFREIVMTGIEISAYGKDLSGKPTLVDALQTASEAAADLRIRLGSLDPRVINDEFCRALRDMPNLCDHFHLSVQSGCDATLVRMGRKYSAEDVLGAITTLRELFPNCGITADLITGFPGESDSEFEKTQQFIRQAAFSDMHIFPFSARPDTKAETLPDQLKKDVKARRARQASEIQAEISQEFKLTQIGKTLDVLLEKKQNGYWSGYSTNYLQVAVRAEKGITRNSVKRVLIRSVDGDVLLGGEGEFGVRNSEFGIL